MNRVISFLMAVAILITGINFHGLEANAAARSEISSESVKAEAGKVISVPINISGNQGIMGFTIYITYDKEAFTPVEVTPSDLLSSGSLQDSIETSGTDSFQVTWAGNSDMNEDGVLFYASFRVAEYARGNYKLRLSYGQPDTFNERWEDVAFECKDTSVTVTSPVMDKAYLSSTGDQAAEAGSRIGIPIQIVNNKGTERLSFHLQYDMSVFHFEEAEYKLAAGGRVTPQKDGLQIELTQIDVSREQGVLLLCFFTVEEYVNGKYIFNMESEDAGTLDFRVCVKNAHSGEAAKICGGEIVKGQGGSVEVPVLIQNNPGIMGLRITVTYDDKALRPTGVRQGALLQGNFDDNIGNKDGEYSVLWNGTENVYGNGELFVASFQIEEPADVTSTVISLSYGVFDTFNEDMQAIELECQDIIITSLDKQTQILAGTDAYTKTYGDKPFLLDVVLERGNGKLTYQSANEEVASVDGDGKVTVKGAGRAAITARASGTDQFDSAAKEIQITVWKASQDIRIELPKAKIKVGETAKMTATAKAGKITFRSKNEKIAVVDGNGAVTGKKAGSVEMEIKAEGDRNYNPALAKTVITVVPNMVTGLKLKSASAGVVSVSWKGTSPYSGYEIRYSMKSNMSSNKTAVQFGGTSAKLKGLSGKICYVQIRAFEETDGVLYYGDWSEKASIIVKPKAVGGVKAKPQAGGKAKISWKKVANISGYQVRYSLKSNMKSSKMIKVQSKSKVKATLKKLKKKKKYYVQVRAYRKAGKRICYGNWSKKARMKAK